MLQYHYLVGVHVHKHGKIGPFSEKYLKILEYNNIQYVALNINEFDFWQQVKRISHFIFHWGGSPDHRQLARTLVPIIEKELSIPVFPDIQTTWHHDDKIRQYFLLKSHGFPVIDSWVFWEKKWAIEWLKNKAVFPLVFKLTSSAGSKDVVKVERYRLARRITKRIFGRGIIPGHVPGNISIKIKDFSWSKFYDQVLKKSYRFIKGRDLNPQWQKEKNYVLFQKFVRGNEYDTRVTIIGNRAFAFRRFNRENDFRSSGSGKINYEKDKIDPRCLKLAFKVSEKFRFQSMAYDLLLDENNQPVICEISYTYQDIAVYNCPGYWNKDLVWQEGHFWPQYCQLVDLLQNPELKQPQLI